MKRTVTLRRMIIAVVLVFMFNNIKVNAQCSGTPVGGTTIVSYPFCNQILLTVAGSSYLPSNGFQLQWEENYGGSGWVNIGTASGTIASSPTGDSTFISGNVSATQFRRMIVCNASGNTDFSTAVTVPFIMSYCNPFYNICTSSGYYIDRVNVLGTAINNTSGAASSSPYYSVFCNNTGMLQQAMSYVLRIYPGSNSADHDVSAWIDFDQSGDFTAPNENIANTIIPGGTGNYHDFPFVVSVTSLLGNTRLRIRASGNTTVTLDPCLSTSPDYDYGETEDYIVNISGASPLIVSPSLVNVCVGDSFQLTCTSALNDSVFWQSELGCAGAWSNLNVSMDSILTTTCFASTCYRAINVYQGVSTYSNSAVVTVMGPVAGVITLDSVNGSIFCFSDSGAVGTIVGWQFDLTSPYDFTPPDAANNDSTYCVDTTGFNTSSPYVFARAIYHYCSLAQNVYSNAVALSNPALGGVFFVYIVGTPPNCGANGTLIANILYGGVPPYTYMWSNGQTTQTAIGIGVGTYSVAVTDSFGLTETGGPFTVVSGCDNIVLGNVYDDLNGNCIYDAGDIPEQYTIVEATNGTQTFYGNANSSGSYSINISIPGTFQISAQGSNWGSCILQTACSSQSVTFPSVGDTAFAIDLGLTGAPGYDLTIVPYCSSANPGFEKEYEVVAWDNGYPGYTDTVTVTFNYDPNLDYTYSYWGQPVDDSLNHTLTWQVADVNSNGYFDCVFNVPASLSLSYLLQSDFSISPTADDCDTTNNHLHFSEVVTSSLDPNVKTVTPTGNITAADSVLTYTIHFQNTGTDTTHFVIVKDTLSQYLNPATVVNLASSAPYSEFNISGTGILEWVFNPLFLPDSASNNAASKGFVMFKIKTKHNLPAGTVISNNASICFDYNSPVVTNTVQNSIISGIKEISDDGSVTVYPNPFSNEFAISSLQMAGSTIIVTDVLGRELLHTKAIAQSETINLTTFSAGVYIISIRNGAMNEVRRVVKE